LLRYDSDERHFARSVSDPPRALVYGRSARDGRGRMWLQYWLYFTANTQDRGVLRTGRHDGDWELVQVRLDARRRPVEATFAQHSWAEGCGWGEVETAGHGLVVYVANGSHALYPRRGVADRPFPDPNDEADGEGRAIRPPVRPIDERTPRWMSSPRRWGDARAGFVPGEESSPRGPAFQPERWRDPSRFHDEHARACGSGPPGRTWQTALTVAFAALGAAALLWLVIRRSYNRGS
jgi:hypothetical protein